MSLGFSQLTNAEVCGEAADEEVRDLAGSQLGLQGGAAVLVVVVEDRVGVDEAVDALVDHERFGQHLASTSQ